MRKAALFATTLSLGLAACGPEAPAPDTETSALGEHGEVVSLLGAGPYHRVRGCSGICISTHYFWADIAVRNLAFHKSVGVRYSGDAWQTYRIAHAKFEQDLGDGWERWGLDVELGTGQNPPHAEIELAAFAQMDGETRWDPKNNYYVYESVFPDRPVRKLDSRVRYEAGRGGILEGTVRVFDLAFDKQVTLRYTTDGWQSWQEADAHWVRGDDWAFEVDGLVDAAGRLPDEVRFAVRYEVQGETFWDNAHGRDYVHRLHPRFTVHAERELGTQWSGIFWPGATPNTQIELDRIEVRTDGGPWQPGDRTVLTTWGLEEGEHLVEVRATTVGGYEAIQPVPFAVRNRIVPRDTWQPRPDLEVPGRSASAWQASLDTQGRVLVLWDSSRIGRYQGPSDVNSPFLFEAPPVPSRLTSFAVDDQDRVYAVGGGRNLIRWTSAGALDPSFGQGGLVGLDGEFAGRTICYTGQLVAGPAALYLPDTCNRRILRFDLQGSFQDALDVGVQGRSGVPVHAVYERGALWVASQGDLLRIEGSASGLRLAERVPLSESLSVSGLALDPAQGFWLTTSNNALLRVSDRGEVIARWQGGPRDAGFEGNFTLARSPLVLPDGTVSVLGVEGARIVRFERVLRP